MERVQSIIDTRYEQSSNKSIIDNRVRGLHDTLIKMLDDSSYDIGYTYKIAKKLSDYDIVKVAEYCQRKANNPGKAFISICEKKIA